MKLNFIARIGRRADQERIIVKDGVVTRHASCGRARVRFSKERDFLGEKIFVNAVVVNGD